MNWPSIDYTSYKGHRKGHTVDKFVNKSEIKDIFSYFYET